MRILHGVSSSAGQPYTISRAQKEIGYDSTCVRFGPSKFGYPADLVVEYGDNVINSASNFLRQEAPHFDLFHFYFRPFYYFPSNTSLFPSGLDFLALRAAGKKIVLHYRGSEIRSADKFRKFSPFHYVDENPDQIFNKFDQDSIDKWTNYISAISNISLVPDHELQSYVPDSQILERALDLNYWNFSGQQNEFRPLVIHAPSRRVIKGTQYILKAVEELKNERITFDFQLIENMSHSEVKNIYDKCDIVIDQLRIGWYGVLSVEAMALGKTVLCYIRPDLIDKHNLNLPIINCNPSNVKQILKDTILNTKLRRELGEKARTYCENTHCSKVVAKKAIDIYEQLDNDFVKNLAPIIDHIEWQYENRLGHIPTRLPIKFFRALKKDGIQEALQRTRSKIKQILWR